MTYICWHRSSPAAYSPDKYGGVNRQGNIMINGIINVYKERGYTSFDVVAKLRGILKTKKIGHTGTLDPEAEGVLPICVGKATKVCGLLTDKDKEYEAVMLLGRTTDTQDTTGTVLLERPVTVTEAKVREAAACFVGDYEQVPPMYSALKVNGKKLCDLARAGVTVERAARRVHIYEIEMEDISLPRVKMRVRCSKGTYIRTLCEDIGEVLGCGACMEALVRTRVSEFGICDALRLSEIEQKVGECAGDIPPGEWETGMFDFIRSVDSVFLHLEKAIIKREWNTLLYNGNRMSPEAFADYRGSLKQAQIRVYDEEGHFIGIYEYSSDRGDYKPVKVFMEA